MLIVPSVSRRTVKDNSPVVVIDVDRHAAVGHRNERATDQRRMVAHQQQPFGVACALPRTQGVELRHVATGALEEDDRNRRVHRTLDGLFEIMNPVC